MAFVKISEQSSLYNDLEKKSVREILEDINTEDHKVADAVYSYMRLSGKEQDIVRKKAWKLSEKAEWKHFFAYYREAYAIALRCAMLRG